LIDFQLFVGSVVRNIYSDLYAVVCFVDNQNPYLLCFDIGPSAKGAKDLCPSRKAAPIVCCPACKYNKVRKMGAAKPSFYNSDFKNTAGLRQSRLDGNIPPFCRWLQTA